MMEFQHHQIGLAAVNAIVFFQKVSDALPVTVAYDCNVSSLLLSPTFCRASVVVAMVLGVNHVVPNQVRYQAALQPVVRLHVTTIVPCCQVTR